MTILQNSLNKIFRFICIRRILAISLAFAVLGLLLPTAYGLSESVEFQRLDYVPGKSGTDKNQKTGRFFFSFSGKVKAKINQDSSVPIFFMDILGAKVKAHPFIMRFPAGPAKLVRLTQISTEPDVIRATFFLREYMAASVQEIKNGLALSFFKSRVSQKNNHKKAYGLIKPVKKKIQPLKIQMDNVDPRILFRELARQLGKAVFFRDEIPSKIKIDLKANGPKDAMKQIADKIGAIVTEENNDFWISNKGNPLLHLSDHDVVEGADLTGLELGNVFRVLGHIAELNIVLDRSLDQIKNTPVQMYLQKMSIRKAFETLLKLHDLTFKSVDENTLLILTQESERKKSDKVVKVIPAQTPVEKLKELVMESVAKHVAERVTIKEDLGNIVLVGDKDAVEQVQTILNSIDHKLLEAGEASVRRIFQPINTPPDDLVKLVTDSISETEKVKVSVDKRTDRLVVNGAISSVKRTLKFLKELDKPQTRQALIHIRLIELQNTDLDTLGIQFPNKLISADNVNSFDPSSIVLPADFTGFKENSKVKTLANPTLRCMDKEEATIDISEQIPIKNTSTEYLPVASASLAARTTDNWTTEEVGIKLSVKPLIHDDNEITMDLDVDLTELLELIEGHPKTAKRAIKTKVRVKDRETVVIGGLIRRRKADARRPVPIVNRIPLLRRLFKSMARKEITEEKGEMIILITPRVVNSRGLVEKRLPMKK